MRRGDKKCPDLKECSVEWPEDRSQRKSKEMSIQAKWKPTSWSNTSRVGGAWWRRFCSLNTQFRTVVLFSVVEGYTGTGVDGQSREQQEGSGASDHLCDPHRPAASSFLAFGFDSSAHHGLVAGRGNREGVSIFFR